jgi:hypothetical protein
MKHFHALIIFLVFGVAAHAQETDIYILAGQSNMVGVAPLAGEPKPQNPSRIWALSHEGNWQPAKDPLYNDGGVGPGVWFADRMATLCPDISVGVVPCAVNASYLSQWTPDNTTYTLYGRMLARARIASAHGTIKGLVWYQGEAETMDRNNAMLYSAKMHALFQSIRADLGIPDLPIIFVQLGPDSHDPRYPYWPTIQSWQQAIASAAPPRIGMVSAKDLKAIPGNPFHLDQESQIILGGRIADAMYNLSSK